MKENRVKQIVDEFIERRVKQVEDPEVCIHPFAYTDSDGNVLPHQQIAEDEFECDDDEVEEEETIEEIEEKIKEIAEQIEDVEPQEETPVLSIPVDVNGMKRCLVDGENCNILPLPLLRVAIITPVNLVIEGFNLDLNAESVLDLEVKTAIVLNDEKVESTGTVGEYCKIGWCTVVESLMDEWYIDALQYRGLVQQISALEILDLMGEE